MGLFKKNKNIDITVPQKLPVDTEQAVRAQSIFKDYKQGKTSLENRIVENEQWYRGRHWEWMKADKDDEVKPSSAWLFNCIQNKHADAMDSAPRANVIPREQGDEHEAEMLSSIIPVILDHCNFEQTYSDVWDDKLKSGTGIYGVFWDGNAHGGLGEIDIRCIDPLALYWEPGVKDIQDSQHVFHTELVNNDVLVSQYPHLNGRLGGNVGDNKTYVYDDNVKNENKSVVLDHYYKKPNSQGKMVLHFAKYVNDIVLYATENMPELAERGWYDDCKFPFVLDTLFKIKGSPAAFGYIDVGRSAQEYIDRGNQAVLENMLAGATPRVIAAAGSGINADEFADVRNKVVTVDGNIDGVRPLAHSDLPGAYIQVLHDKIEELKETTGNRDVSTGGTTSGVTAASGIAALIENSGKLSRDSGKASYRRFKDVVYMVIERIRQFYTIERKFRIVGERGAAQYVSYSNVNIAPQQQGMAFGEDMGIRVPQFDIEVTAEKKSEFTRLSQNELALQFYGAGFFAVQNSDAALACLDMMDFDKKQDVIDKISENGTLYQQVMAMQQQMMMLAQIVDRYKGTGISQGLAAQFGIQSPNGVPNRAPNLDNTQTLGGEVGEPKNVTKSKQRTAEATSPV